ncbi:T6SS effector amidase Tae4 family protein [Flavobacterium sp.]|uniref:T6SS effector amidase Tae4 family protein n=1 Tax=Flavobacterium sp. TaxID=239 RepID=UPI0025D59A57|nr:T6SS effector amidase Tae4 family protein [Flavobacterium sp.]
MPSFNDFKNACPSKYDNGQVVCTNIGGGALTMYNNVANSGFRLNTCALRVSRALNYSGIIIPALPDNPNGTKNTVVGSDGKNYIISAKVLNAWLRKTFGTNPSNYQHYTASQGGAHGVGFSPLLANINGIYSMVSLPAIQHTWATGHADLLNSNSTCGNHCLFYEAPILRLDVWELN